MTQILFSSQLVCTTLANGCAPVWHVLPFGVQNDAPSMTCGPCAVRSASNTLVQATLGVGFVNF